MASDKISNFYYWLIDIINFSGNLLCNKRGNKKRIMKNNIKNFLKKLSILTVVCFIIGYTINNVIPEKYSSTNWFYILIFFAILTFLFHISLVKYFYENIKKFLLYYLVATVVKLILCMILILGYVYFINSQTIPFLIWFSIFYLFFTTFEVVTMLYSAKK